MTQTDHPIDERTHQLLVKAAHGLIAIVGVIVLVVSSYYLRRYAINTGMPEWLAWTLFVALDAGGTAGTLCWLLATGPVRTWGKVIALANLSASIVGNVLGHLIEAKMLPVTPVLVILTGVVYPAELWALVHLGIQLRTQRPIGEEETAQAVTAERISQPDTPPAPTPPAVQTPPTRNTPDLANPLAVPTQRSTPPIKTPEPVRSPQLTPAVRGGELREGRSNSRKRVVTAEIENRIRDLWEQGLTLQEVMRRSGYKRSTCMRIKQALNEIEKEHRERVA